MEDGLDVARIAFVSDELPDSKCKEICAFSMVEIKVSCISSSVVEGTLILEEEVYEHCKLWFGALPQIVKVGPSIHPPLNQHVYMHL